MRRLQARIAEAAQALGMTVSWPLPDAGDLLMTEDFKGMEHWLGRIAATIQQDADETHALKVRPHGVLDLIHSLFLDSFSMSETPYCG